MVYETASQANVAKTASRIECDTEMVKSMTIRLETVADRIIRHARTLGYYEPTPSSVNGAAAPAPVITSLADALRALDRAVDHCSGSLNVFD